VPIGRVARFPFNLIRPNDFSLPKAKKKTGWEKSAQKKSRQIYEALGETQQSESGQRGDRYHAMAWTPRINLPNNFIGCQLLQLKRKAITSTGGDWIREAGASRMGLLKYS